MTIEEAFEEICCDSLGDMNVFAGTGRVDDARYSQLLTSAKKSAERQANQGRAPPKNKGVKYSREASGTIKEQIKNASNSLNKMDVVATVNAPNLKGMTIKQQRQWAENFLKTSGYAVERQGFGKIEFTPKHINEGLNYLSSPAEVAAFAALPRVLKRGIEIDTHDRHKGRQRGSITIAAPVIINGVRGNMAVVVTVTSKNHYHAHRILLPNGSEFTFDIKKVDPTPAEAAPNAESSPIRSTEDSIPASSENVNTETSLESKQLTELRRENRELKERVEFWRGQTQRTTAKSVRNGDIKIHPPPQRFHTPQAYFTLQSNISQIPKGFISLKKALVKRQELFSMERMTGIEPASPAWEAGALPLDDIRMQCPYFTPRGLNMQAFPLEMR